MKKFSIQIIFFCSLIALTMISILFFADGHSDSFYLKVSSSEKKNLIIGTSKAAQGLQPAALKTILGKDFYNFAFTIHHSPYGEVYLKSIKEKTDTTFKDQTFILTVDIWSLSSTTKTLNDSLYFREHNSFLNRVSSNNHPTNFDYLINEFGGKYFNLLSKNSTAFLHDDGWLEVLSLSKNNEDVKRRTAFTLKTYQEKIDTYHFSQNRLSYLVKTIDFLNQYGNVHLVRLPVSPDLKNIEEKITTNFNKKIEAAIFKSKDYLDLSVFNNEFNYTDGVHLEKNSGMKVSKQIALWIKDKP